MTSLCRAAGCQVVDERADGRPDGAPRVPARVRRVAGAGPEQRTPGWTSPAALAGHVLEPNILHSTRSGKPAYT